MTLTKQLLARNEIYTVATNSIIDKYRDTLDTTFDNIVESKMSINWTSIDFHPANRLLLNVIGEATHKIGSTVRNIAGESIYIDETNISNYNKLMRFLLPLDPVSSGDTDALVQFLKEYSSIVERYSQEELEHSVADLTFLIEHFSIFSKKFEDVKINKADLHDGFDLNKFDLDEVQLRQLKMLRPEGEV